MGFVDALQQIPREHRHAIPPPRPNVHPAFVRPLFIDVADHLRQYDALLTGHLTEGYSTNPAQEQLERADPHHIFRIELTLSHLLRIVSFVWTTEGEQRASYELLCDQQEEKRRKGQVSMVNIGGVSDAWSCSLV